MADGSGMLTVAGLYDALRKEHGHMGWWPGDTADEIVIGAVLTQRTSWSNVEMAIANLREAGRLSIRGIGSMRTSDLERDIRPAGFYRQKAATLKGFAAHAMAVHGSLRGMLSTDTSALRKELLSLKGIGPETADSILLYAANRPVFVIDAYTRRIMGRIYGMDSSMGYDEMQGYIEARVARSASLYNDFHAQLVEHGKRRCRTKPLCNGCPVKSYCLHGAGQRH